MIKLIPALLLVTGFGFCSQEVNNNIITGPSNPGTGNSGAPCSGLAVLLNVDVESGTSGGTGSPGEPLVFSADPRDASGQSLPAACRTGVVTAQVTGACTTLQGQPTLENITTTPTSLGACRVDVTFSSVTGSRTVTVD